MDAGELLAVEEGGFKVEGLVLLELVEGEVGEAHGLAVLGEAAPDEAAVFGCRRRSS